MKKDLVPVVPVCHLPAARTARSLAEYQGINIDALPIDVSLYQEIDKSLSIGDLVKLTYGQANDIGIIVGKDDLNNQVCWIVDSELKSKFPLGIVSYWSDEHLVAVSEIKSLQAPKIDKQPAGGQNSHEGNGDDNSSLADYSPIAAELLTPIFGENCHSLDREQAYLLAEASAYAFRQGVSLSAGLKELEQAGDFSAGIETWQELIERKVAPAKVAEVSKNLKTLDLDELDLLALTEFLYRELRLGRWSVLPRNPILKKAIALGYQVHHCQKDDDKLVISGLSNRRQEYIYCQGSFNFVRALLDAEQTKGFFSDFTSVASQLTESRDLLETIQSHLQDLSSINQVGLTQKEKDSWSFVSQTFLAGLQPFLELIESREQEAISNDFFEQASHGLQRYVEKEIEEIRSNDQAQADFHKSLHRIGKILGVPLSQEEIKNESAIAAKVVAALVQLDYINSQDAIVKKILAEAEAGGSENK